MQWALPAHTTVCKSLSRPKKCSCEHLHRCFLHTRHDLCDYSSILHQAMIAQFSHNELLVYANGIYFCMNTVEGKHWGLFLLQWQSTPFLLKKELNVESFRTGKTAGQKELLDQHVLGVLPLWSLVQFFLEVKSISAQGCICTTGCVEQVGMG